MNSKKFVKNLCNAEDLKYEDIARILTDKMHKKYTYQSLCGKLARNSFTYAEAFALAEALGYDLITVKRKEK